MDRIMSFQRTNLKRIEKIDINPPNVKVFFAANYGRPATEITCGTWEFLLWCNDNKSDIVFSSQVQIFIRKFFPDIPVVTN